MSQCHFCGGVRLNALFVKITRQGFLGGKVNVQPQSLVSRNYNSTQFNVKVKKTVGEKKSDGNNSFKRSPFPWTKFCRKCGMKNVTVLFCAF